MHSSLTRWSVGGFLFTAAGGVLLHFLYELTGELPLIGLCSAVNESIWEHLKLLYLPAVVFALIQARTGAAAIPAYWWAKLGSILAGMAVIPLLYYTYTGALGVSADWFNIFIFFVAAATTFLLEAHLLRHARPRHHPKVALASLLGLWVVFGWFTFFPPHLPLFRDPLTGTYGL